VVTGTTTIIGTTVITAVGDQADTGTALHTIAAGMTATHTTEIAAADVTTGTAARVMAGATVEVTAMMVVMMMTVMTIAVNEEATPVHAITDNIEISTVTTLNARKSLILKTSPLENRTGIPIITGW
jgi:hypothetical protein